jgi:hypothetical protein
VIRATSALVRVPSEKCHERSSELGNALYLCMPCASARTIERRREIFILAGAMKRMLLLTVILWLGVSATAHTQVNSPTNAASTVTGEIVPSGQGVTSATGGGFSPFVPVPLLCPFGPFGVSLSVMLTPFFGCASDPLSATYQISAGPAVVITGPVGSISANARTATPTVASGAGGAGGGVSSSAGCLGAIPSTAGSVGAGDLFGGIGGC